ncbi:hypothetical protein ACROYT_G014437 [Oculina patagonica]
METTRKRNVEARGADEKSENKGASTSQQWVADEASGDSVFFVSKGKTFIHGKNETHEFADFKMKIVGEIHPNSESGGGDIIVNISSSNKGVKYRKLHKFGQQVCKQIIKQVPLASSDFDSRQKIFNSLRAVFPNGTLSLGESASNKIVAKYFTHLKQKYVNSVSEDESLKRICYQTDSLGRQSHSYWLLSPEAKKIRKAFMPDSPSTPLKKKWHSSMARRWKEVLCCPKESVILNRVKAACFLHDIKSGTCLLLDKFRSWSLPSSHSIPWCWPFDEGRDGGHSTSHPFGERVWHTLSFVLWRLALHKQREQ